MDISEVDETNQLRGGGAEGICESDDGFTDKCSRSLISSKLLSGFAEKVKSKKKILLILHRVKFFIFCQVIFS